MTCDLNNSWSSNVLDLSSHVLEKYILQKDHGKLHII